ncbi:MAG: hypothetical protein A2X94_06345 [Bdellovibrionales bacterium GWB1_55_8]|nr:MAG: hypothetical protein A2X94_06345 [Bdellovibrionales bacterium GWB1_55_8]
MKKSFLGKRRPISGDMSLQITSMADIFIIILVFLLKSFSSGAMAMSPSQGTRLPQAETQDLGAEALKIEISETVVQVEGKPAVNLAAFRFQKTDLQANGSSKALNQILEVERKRQILIAKANSDVKVDAKVIVMADERAPYATVKSVLASAALNGYTDFKLAVVKGE